MLSGNVFPYYLTCFTSKPWTVKKIGNLEDLSLQHSEHEHVNQEINLEDAY